MKPTKERNHAGVLLTLKGEGLLFDCGEGTQRQLICAGIRPTLIKKIFISHWHGDHILGLPGLIQTLSASEYTGTLHIYGPKGSKRFLALALSAFAGKALIDINVHEVSVGKVLEEEEYAVYSDSLHHSVPCVGYAFIENDRRKIDMKKVRKIGIPEGPLIGKLQEGNEIIFKGKKILPDDVGYVQKGRKVVYVTDTRPCNGALKLAKCADILIIESTYSSDLEDKAVEYCHLTAKEAALIANQAKVKKCILTHFSVRYKQVQEIEEDARKIFDDTQAAKDLMRVVL